MTTCHHTDKAIKWKFLKMLFQKYQGCSHHSHTQSQNTVHAAGCPQDGLRHRRSLIQHLSVGCWLPVFPLRSLSSSVCGTEPMVCSTLAIEEDMHEQGPFWTEVFDHTRMFRGWPSLICRIECCRLRSPSGCRLDVTWWLKEEVVMEAAAVRPVLNFFNWEVPEQDMSQDGGDLGGYEVPERMKKRSPL